MARPALRLFQAYRDPYNCLVLARTHPLPASHGPLSNTTFVAKDNFATTLEPTTCGSKMLQNYVSPFTATAVKLLEAAGLVMVGKANMDEFGMGSSTTFSASGATLNPRFAQPHIAGGSSGGSAAAVAAGLADFSLGTDTGGSVRLPASYCGIVGFKPSYGRISRYGVVAYGQGFDCVGIMAKDVATTSKVFSVLDQHDPKDITAMPVEIRQSIDAEQEKRKEEERKGSLRIGVPQELILRELKPEAMVQFQKTVARLMDMGHTVHAVSVPAIFKLLAAYYTLAPAEAASNLSRFDGIRYGHCGEAASGDKLIVKNRSEGLGTEVQRRIILGNYTLSSESGDNYFRATKLREMLVAELNDVFAMPNHIVGTGGAAGGCDVLLAPTAFGQAPSFEQYEKERDETFLNEYLNDVLTVAASMAGLPAISVPCEDEDYGVQIMGQLGDDKLVLEVAAMAHT